MLIGYIVAPWGDGKPFLRLRGDVFGERWEGADFNRRLQEAFGIWGFAVLIAVAIAAVVAIRYTTSPALLIPLMLALVGGAIWHQGMIGTVNGLNLMSHLPQLGAVVSAIGLAVAVSQPREPAPNTDAG